MSNGLPELFSKISPILIFENNSGRPYKFVASLRLVDSSPDT
jgi:hypothetical protein